MCSTGDDGRILWIYIMDKILLLYMNLLQERLSPDSEPIILSWFYKLLTSIKVFYKYLASDWWKNVLRLGLYFVCLSGNMTDEFWWWRSY
jgi:hypothetical protein